MKHDKYTKPTPFCFLSLNCILIDDHLCRSPYLCNSDYRCGVENGYITCECKEEGTFVQVCVTGEQAIVVNSVVDISSFNNCCF